MRNSPIDGLDEHPVTSERELIAYRKERVQYRAWELAKEGLDVSRLFALLARYRENPSNDLGYSVNMLDIIEAEMDSLPRAWLGELEGLKLVSVTRLTGGAGGLVRAVLFNPGEVDVSVSVMTSREARDVVVRGGFGLKLFLRAATEDSLTVTMGSETLEEPITACPDAGPTGDRIHVVSHFHYDPVWLRDQREYTQIAFRLCDAFLEYLEREPGAKCLLSEMDYLKPYIDHTPGAETRLRRLIAEDRLETSCAYSEPNEMTISGEGLVRNLAYGVHYFSSTLGDTPRTYLPFDVFGHTPQLPQVLARAGFDSCLWSKYNMVWKYPGSTVPQLFWHTAPDGTRLLTRNAFYGEEAEELQSLVDQSEGRLGELARLGLSSDIRLIGEDVRFPQTWMVGHSDTLKGTRPGIELSTARDYFEDVRGQHVTGGARIPVITRDFSLYHAGTALSRTDLKRGNFLCESMLVTAEMASCAAVMFGADYPEWRFDRAWRQVLFNQHHDGITGTSCDTSYIDMMLGYREALGHARVALDDALEALAFSVSLPEGLEGKGRVLVFNPSNRTRTDLVSVETDGPMSVSDVEGLAVESDWEEGMLAFLARDVPGIGWSTYIITPLPEMVEEARGSKEQGNVLDNGLIRVEVDPSRGGGIVSIRDLKTGREYLDVRDHPGNDIVFLEEELCPSREPSWEVWTTGGRRSTAEQQATVVRRDDGWGSTLVVNTPGIERRISLRDGSRRLDFITTIFGYDGEDDLVCTVFPSSLHGSIPVYGDTFGTTVRKRSAGRFDFRTAMWTVPGECAFYAADGYCSLSRSVVIRETSATPGGEQGRRIPLGMCGVLFEEGDEHLYERLASALIRHGIGCTPFGGDIDTLRQDGSYTPFIISIGQNPYTTQLLVRNGASTGVRSDATPWFVEDEGRRVLIIPGSGEELSDLVADLAVSITEDRTLPVLSEHYRCEGPPLDDASMTVIHRGTLPVAVENDSTMVLALYHTAAYAFEKNPGSMMGAKLDPYLVPEQKDHVYEYSLLLEDDPLTVAREAHEVKHPLVGKAFPTGFHWKERIDGRKDAPATGQLLDIASDVICQAVKMGDYRYAGNHHDGPDGSMAVTAEVTARVLEPVGEDGVAPLENTRGMDVVEMEAGSDVSGPRTVSTFRSVIPGKLSLSTPEDCHPRHSRYYLHNEGAAPECNQPFSIQLQREGTRTYVLVMNRWRDHGLTGRIRVECPDGYQVDVGGEDLPIPALGDLRTDITDLLTGHEREGGSLYALLISDGMTIYDVMRPSDRPRLKVHSGLSEDGIAVTVSDSTPGRTLVSLDVTVPMEMWGTGLTGKVSRGTIGPDGGHPGQEHHRTFWLDEGKEERIVFPFVGGIPPSTWCVVKTSYEGLVDYTVVLDGVKDGEEAAPWKLSFLEQRGDKGEHKGTAKGNPSYVYMGPH